MILIINVSRLKLVRKVSHAWLLICFLFLSTTLQAALTLDAVVNHTPVMPNELLQLDLTVTNNSMVTRSGVTLTMVFPEDLNQLFVRPLIA